MSQSMIPARRGDDGLFARAKAGDQAAWEELVQRCNNKVRRVIRNKLREWREMRSLYDSTDFASDVWKSLVAKSDRFDFPNADALTAFLRKAACQKLIDAARRMHTLKEDVGRERRLATLLGPEAEGPFDVPSPDPTPSQWAQAHEAREQILAEAETDQERELIESKFRGLSNQELADQTGRNVRWLQRYFEKVWESWFARTGGDRQ